MVNKLTRVMFIIAACQVMMLSALADVDVQCDYVDGCDDLIGITQIQEPVALPIPIQIAPGYQPPPPEGAPFPSNIEGSPAVSGEVRIPLLQAAPEQIQPIQEIQDETDFVPSPPTGRAPSSRGIIWLGVATLGAALLITGKKRTA